MPFIITGDVEVSTTSDPRSIFMAIHTFLETFQAEEPILLIEMGGMARFKEQTEMTLINLSAYFHFAQVVLSFSSGGGNFISNIGNAIFKKIIREGIDLLPFNEAEVELFMGVYKLPSCLDKHECKRLTNYNPSLLFACHQCEDMKAVKDSIDSVIRDYVEEIRLSFTVESNNFTWILESLPESIEMLHYAANDEVVPQCEWSDYVASWI